MQIVSIHPFSASTVLPCTADSRDPYSSTSSSSWVLVNLRLLSLVQLFWIFWIFWMLVWLVGHITSSNGAMFKLQSTFAFGCIFNWEAYSIATSGKAWRQRVAARLDVGFCFWPGLKAGGWFRKGLCCMHCHGLEASSVILALILAGTLLMTQTHRCLCLL